MLRMCFVCMHMCTFLGFKSTFSTIHKLVFNDLTYEINDIHCRHLDGNHKLIRWRFVIHGGIDGFSRTVVFLKASSNNLSSTVLHLFQTATHVFHYPRRIRTDHGTENVAVAREMLHRYGPLANPVITGQSVHNQRIERLWRDVFTFVLTYYKNLFHYLESQQVLDPDDEIDAYALQYVYLPRINKALDHFVSQWNNHPLSSEGNRTPLQKWTEGFYQFANSDYTTVRELLDPNTTNFLLYGIDDDGRFPDLQRRNDVQVPRSTVELSDNAYNFLVNLVNPLANDDNHGITLYEQVNSNVRDILLREQ